MTTEPTSNWITGAVTFKGEFVDELAVYCIDIEPELEALGHMRQDYIASAAAVIYDIKAGASFKVIFRGTEEQYPLEVIQSGGIETLEVAEVGQPSGFKTLRNLPQPG